MSSLTDSRVRHGAKACVEAVRADYPKFNKCLLSQCEAPEKYGVQLVPEAAASIKALDAPKNRVDRRKKSNRRSSWTGCSRNSGILRFKASASP